MFIKRNEAEDLFIVPITALVGFSPSISQRKPKMENEIGRIDVPREIFRIVATTIGNIIQKNAFLWTISLTPSSYKIVNDPITRN